MTQGRIFRMEMLPNPIYLEVADPNLDFSQARRLADAEAGKRRGECMLLSWYNGKTGEFSPPVECGGGDKPSWLVYAESRGGEISVSVNEGEFVFLYKKIN